MKGLQSFCAQAPRAPCGERPPGTQRPLQGQSGICRPQALFSAPAYACCVTLAPSPPLMNPQEQERASPHLPSQGPLPRDCGLAVLRVCSAGPVSPQGMYSTFVYSYAVEKPLSVRHKVAGYLPSLFWGFITLGHLVSIPISSRVKPATMVCVNVVSGLLSLLGDVENRFLLALPLHPDLCPGWSSATRVGL